MNFLRTSQGLLPLLAVCLLATVPAFGQSAQDHIREAYGLLKEDRWQSAEQKFLKALEQEAESKEARFGLGTVYIKQERYREALDIMEALIRENPDDYFIKNNAAWVYATANDYSIRNGERALKLAQDALLSQPDSYHVWSTLSEAYYVTADYTRALRAAEQALRLGFEQQISQDNLDSYKEQLLKCRRATQALSLIE